MFRRYYIGIGIALVAASSLLSQQASAQAMDDWQVHLADGSYVYELHVKALRATDVVFEHDGEQVQIPLEQMDEMRRIHKSFKHGTGGARATFGGLAGADDDVVQLMQYSVREKHDILAKVLAIIASDSSSDKSRASHGSR